MARPLNQQRSATGARLSWRQRMHNIADVSARSGWTKLIFITLSFVPAVAMMWAASNRNLDAVTDQLIMRQTGDWALSFLILTLAITPLRKLLDLPDMIRFRRALGLFAFFYGFLHVATWRVLKLGHALHIGPLTIWSLRIGFLGFLLMIPLAMTSTDWWVRWLGGKRWRALHSLAYLSAIAGIAHYWLLPAIGVWKPVACGLAIALLLFARFKTLASRTYGDRMKKSRSDN
jgi:methionine sulfoxide reductase heme-binding subunit